MGQILKNKLLVFSFSQIGGKDINKMDSNLLFRQTWIDQGTITTIYHIGIQSILL